MRRFSQPLPDQTQPQRRGAIFVLAALALVLIFGFTAFTVDVGFIAMTKGQLQNAADAGALAGVMELADGLGLGAIKTSDEAADSASLAAAATVGSNRAAELNSVYSDANRDVRVGNYSYDSVAGAWVKQWGVPPYNMVEVTLHRDQPGSTTGDGPLDLFFAPVMGTNQANLSVTSTAVLFPGGGIGAARDNDGIFGILPITLDEPTWDALLAATSPSSTFPDDYSYDETTGQVTPGTGDGVLEVNLYPNGNIGEQSNRGTLDIGETNNSASDISRQILHGLNDSDMEAIGGSLTWPRWFSGDPGISAGIKDELEAIKGLPRTIPIFEYTNNGHGGNLDYYIVKLVPIRIVNVRLVGSRKQVMIQPATVVADDVIPGEVAVTVDAQDLIFTPGTLINNN